MTIFDTSYAEGINIHMDVFFAAAVMSVEFAHPVA
jgi:hypothetical protein